MVREEVEEVTKNNDTWCDDDEAMNGSIKHTNATHTILYILYNTF